MACRRIALKRRGSEFRPRHVDFSESLCIHPQRQRAYLPQLPLPGNAAVVKQQHPEVFEAGSWDRATATLSGVCGEWAPLMMRGESRLPPKNGMLCARPFEPRGKMRASRSSGKSSLDASWHWESGGCPGFLRSGCSRRLPSIPGFLLSRGNSWKRHESRTHWNPVACAPRTL